MTFYILSLLLITGYTFNIGKLNIHCLFSSSQEIPLLLKIHQNRKSMPRVYAARICCAHYGQHVRVNASLYVDIPIIVAARIARALNDN